MTDPLEDRVARLEAIQGLHALKARYAEAADQKYGDDLKRKSAPELEAAARRQADCFTHDAVWFGGEFGGDIVGREELFCFFCNGPWQFTSHYYLAPALAVAGPTATGSWRLWQLGVRDGRVELLMGQTIESYRLTDQGWRIHSMRFTKLHGLALGENIEAIRCLVSMKDIF